MTSQEAILFLKSKLSIRVEIHLICDEITCYYRLKPGDKILKAFVSDELLLVKEEMKKAGFVLKARPGFRGKPTNVWSHYESKIFVGSGFSFKKQ